MRFFRLQGVAVVLAVALVLGLTIAVQQSAYAQATSTTSGMAGTVTDPSGAALPGVTVTLSNPTTGLKYVQTTNSIGAYRFSEIPPGQGYEATFVGSGFSPVDVKDIYLTVANVRTQNATLAVGGRAEAIEVTASNSEATIDTTSATIGNTFDTDKLNNLPVQQRNDPTALFTMQPGVTETGSVTGARVDQNYITIDGLDVNDLATGGAVQSNSGSGVSSGFSGTIVGHAPVDSIEEFKGNVAGVEANTGEASGGQYQLVTKSGTNKFHGNINEYHRDASLVANSWFSNNSYPVVPRNNLIQNQFGGAIGGPIKRDKAFFFFDFYDSRIVSSLLTQRTVPLDNLRAGDVGYINSAGSVSYLTPAQVAGFDPAGIGEDTTWMTGFNNRFPHSNNTFTGDGVNSGGYTFNAPNNDDAINYVSRIDYNINDRMKLFGRFTISRENAVEYSNEFAGDPPTSPFIDRSYAFVIGHTWVIGDNKTNRAFFGETVEKFSFPVTYNPDGSTFYIFGNGTGPALASSFYLQPNTQARRIPIPMIGDDFSYNKGRHTWQMGGTFKDILAHDTDVADYNTTEIGMGGYTFSLTPNMRPADINTSASLGNEAGYDYDQAFAFMLGRIADVSSDYNYNAAGNVLPQLSGDQRMYRYYQTQFYAQDTWKLLPSLTVSYGVTYQWFSVPYETHGLESVEPFTFDSYFKTREAQSAASQTGPTAVPLIAYYLGGKGNGNAPPLYQPQYKNFSPHVGFAWNPGFDKKTVFNASAGLVYDRTIINAIQHTQDADSYLFQQTAPTPLGVPGNATASIQTSPRLDSNNQISTVTLTPPASPRPPYEPFTTNGVPFGLQNGLAFNATIDPSLKNPYSIIFNGGIQRQMPGDMVLKVNYAGRLGRRLLGQADANQILEFPDPVSGQLLSQAFGALTQQLRQGVAPSAVTPQPWFENVMGGAPAGYTSFTQFLAVQNTGEAFRGDFGDTVQFLADNGAPLNVGSAAQFSENTFYGNKGFSAYNGFLLTLQKNRSHGLSYDVNYTFAHSIDNVSFFANSSGDTGIGGVGLICDVVRPRECRANSDYDVKHYITGDATYELPFGRGKTFMASAPFWMNEVIGGWELSDVTVWHTGQAWGTNSNAFVASYSNDAPGILIGPKSAVATHLVKTPGNGVNIFANQANAAAAYEGPIGFQIGARNSLRGPGYVDADLGLGKTFPVYREGVNLKFRADAFNAFNHPNFSLPAENGFNGLDQQDITSSTFGEISYTVGPPGNNNNGARVLQLSLRLEF